MPAMLSVMNTTLCTNMKERKSSIVAAPASSAAANSLVANASRPCHICNPCLPSAVHLRYGVAYANSTSCSTVCGSSSPRGTGIWPGRTCHSTGTVRLPARAPPRLPATPAVPALCRATKTLWHTLQMTDPAAKNCKPTSLESTWQSR